MGKERGLYVLRKERGIYEPSKYHRFTIVIVHNRSADSMSVTFYFISTMSAVPDRAFTILVILASTLDTFEGACNK